jgi:hypothetical protein
MADICEVCLERIDHWEDPTPNHDEIILCSECSEEVNEINNKHHGNKSLKACITELRKMKNKMNKPDSITGKFDVMIEQKNTEEASRLFDCTNVEYMHNKDEFSFDHHLMFWKGKKLIFKVWLPNDINDNEFKSINSALESVGIKILKLN